MSDLLSTTTQKRQNLESTFKLSPFQSLGFGVQQKVEESVPASKAELWESYQQAKQLNQKGENSVSSVPIQAKLTVGEPGDKYEQEADSMAAQVIQLPAQGLVNSNINNSVQAQPIQRACTECQEDKKEESKQEEEGEQIQAKETIGQTSELTSVRRRQDAADDEPTSSKSAGSIDQRKSIDNNLLLTHQPTTDIQRDPDKMPPKKGTTTINRADETITASGKTITEAITSLTSQGKGEPGRVTCAPALDPKTYQAADSSDVIVYEADVTVTETKAMPVWTELDQQCEPVKREWARFYQALDTHEEGHINIDKASFKDLHKKLLGKTEAVANEIFKNTATESDTKNDAYDTKTAHGLNQGTAVNPVQCQMMEKVSDDRESYGEGTEVQAKFADSVIQRAADDTPSVPTDLEDRLNSSKGGGSPLADDVRSFMEPRFGADFSGVRVHTGSDSVRMNQDVNAQAFAHGQDVYFGAGKAPGKDALTAHELTHVVQQNNKISRSQRLNTVQKDPAIFPIQAKLTIGQPGDKYEQEADSTAAHVMQMPEPGLANSNITNSLQTRSIEPIQRACSGCQEEPKEIDRIQAKAEVGVIPSLAADLTAKTFSTGDLQRSSQNKNNLQPLLMRQQPEGTTSTTTTPKQIESLQAQSNDADPLIQRVGVLDKLADFGEEAGWAIVGELSPELVPMLKKGSAGIFEWMKNLIGSSVEGIFSTLMAPVKSITGVEDRLAAHFAPLLGSIQTAAGQISNNDCKPISEAAEQLEKAAASLITPIVEKLQPVIAKIKETLDGIWDKIGAPIWGWIKDYASDQWKQVQDLSEQISKIASSLWKTSGGSKMWTWLKNKLGMGDDIEGQNGLKQWVQRKVEEAWNALKVKLEPFQKELTTIGLAVAAVAVAVSPAGPVIAIGAAVVGAVQGLRWIGAHWGKGNLIVKSREYLQNSLIPALQGAAHRLSTTFQQMAGTLSSALGNLAAGMMRAVGAISGSLLKVATSAIQWIADRVQALASWAEQQLNDLSKWLDEAMVKLQVFLQKMLDFFVEVGHVVSDIWRLPAFLAKGIWTAIPECIRDPIIDFIGPIILRQVEIFQALARDNDAWQKTKADVMGIINLVFTDGDLIGAVKATFHLILRVFNIPPELLGTVIQKAESAWDLVSKDPLEFIKNIVRSIGKGFLLLGSNIGEHLKFGLIGWLTGGLAENNITLPESWSEPKQVFGFVLDVVGINVNHLWELVENHFEDKKQVQKLRERMGQAAGVMEWIDNAIDTSKSPAENTAGIIEQAKDFGASILTGIAEWVATQVATEIATLAAAAAASGGLSEVLDVIRRIYKAILSAVRWARQILDMVNQTLDDITTIASGNIEAAGAKLEQVMHQGMPVVIGFLADQVGLGGIGTAIKDIITPLRAAVDKALNWLIDKLKGGIKGLIGAVKSGVNRIAEFFGVREPFTTDNGEAHSIYYEDRGGTLALIVASDPKSIYDFLDFYANENSITSDSPKGKLIAEIRNYLKKNIEPVVKQVNTAKKNKDTDLEKSNQSKLLEENKVLAQKLRSLLSGDRDVGKIIDSYLLEGLTGTYAGMPSNPSDKLTPDHQPQAAILEWAAEQKFFGSTSNMSSRAAGRASQGYAINLYETRHMEGRTYGSKGSQTKNSFINKVDLELTGVQTAQKKRDIVVNCLKPELAADVSKMKSVINSGNANTTIWGDIHALNITQKEKTDLINKIRSNVLKGEDQIANQDLESLKN
jgi:Domain of unknown function (DUF4157)/Bacterial protein of unknown function (DUF922)